jgi:hypothetical protein
MCIDLIDGVDTPEGALHRLPNRSNTMCNHVNMTDLVDMPEDGIVRGKCGHLCAQCIMQRANVYGAELPFIPAPSIHPDAIGPEEERALRELSALREQIAQRKQVALDEGHLWLFD